jgi:hypothetical protein
VEHHLGMGHGGRYGQTMFTKQVSGLVDSLDPPIVPRRRSRSSELEERPAPGPNPSFCALQAQQQVHEREEHGPEPPRRQRPDPMNSLAEGMIAGFCALQLAGLSPNGSASPECAEASGLAATIPARSNKPMLATTKSQPS